MFELPVNNVAEQLSLIELGLLSEIRLSELCDQAWNRPGKEERARNVLQYIAWFNRVSRWVSTQIITQPEALSRAAAIDKFVSIGTALCAMNNFNGVVEILSALHSSAIARLKETWALVPKETMAALEELDMLMNTDGNFRFYRQLLDKSKPPVVPYMGLLLTDLTFLDDANLTELGKGEEGSKLLNLEKIRMLAGVYRLFRRCLTKPYTYSELRSVRKLLLNIEGFDDNELYRLSKLRESGGGGSGTQGATAAPGAGIRQRKLISQMTSSMLVPAKLNLSEDVMGEREWRRLRAVEGVALVTRRQGELLVQQGSKVSILAFLCSLLQ